MYPYNNNFYQPQMAQYPIQNPLSQNGNSLIRVSGIDGARAYQMSANSTVALFDNNSDLMFIKTTDGAGFPTIRVFRFEEVKENVQTQTADYVRREEFEKLKTEVENYGKQFISKANEKPNSRGKDTN